LSSWMAGGHCCALAKVSSRLESESIANVRILRYSLMEREERRCLARYTYSARLREFRSLVGLSSPDVRRLLQAGSPSTFDDSSAMRSSASKWVIVYMLFIPRYIRLV
jgi:hypothetical protein